MAAATYVGVVESEEGKTKKVQLYSTKAYNYMLSAILKYLYFNFTLYHLIKNGLYLWWCIVDIVLS